ncbi:MAG: tetratricopeptide repeat protein [Phycisphaerales bacterium]
MNDDANSKHDPRTGDPDQTLTNLGAGPQDRSASAEHPGQAINEYTLIRLLGEGGFGTVWLAEQHKPVQRQVALKIIKLGMDTRQVIMRFEAERQALAVMDHPNIAKVFDAGATESGRPYFVMEYTDGIPFTRYCDEHKLNVRDRLRLFQKVCLAVQHAHQKGIIHRDIKPSNVLVATVDGEPTPKVIDFGIAKATQARLTEHSMFTEQGQVIGTPAYMSPEQAGLTGDDIDMRSDVYALGVLLYEAVTGETPFNKQTLLSAGMDEIKRIIREVDPPKPSTRLSKASESTSEIAEQRAVEPRRLGSLVMGDIDWIVMKALEKDRARRYQTATGFAEDIDRYLQNEPVLASPPGKRYRLGKFVRRNKRAVIASALVFLALIAGTAGTTLGFVRATRAEGLALQSAQEAEERAEEAQTERDKAEQVAQFLTDMLSGVGAQVAQGADTKLLRGILDRTATRVGEELAGHPEVEAKVRSHLGETYVQIRDFKRGDENLRRALELYQSVRNGDDPDVAQSLGNIGVLLRTSEASHAEAVEFHREALSMWRRLEPEDRTRIPRAEMDLANSLVRGQEYEEAERLLTSALAGFRGELSEESELVGIAYNSIANLKQNSQDYEEAERYYRLAIDAHRAALGDDHPFVTTNLHNLSLLLSEVGRNKEAIELHEQGLARCRVLYPDGHEQTASHLMHLATLYRFDDARSSEAPGMLEEAIAIQIKLYGEESRAVAGSYFKLGDVLDAIRQRENAVAAYGRSAEIYTLLHGEENSNDVAVSLQARARTLAFLGRYNEANNEYDRVLAIQAAVFGDTHPELATTLVNIGAMHRQAENYEAAKAAIYRALEVFDAAGLGRTNSVASSYENLGRIFRAQDRLTDSADALRNALDIRREVSGPNSRNTLGAGYAFAGTLIEIEAFDEAESLLLHALDDPDGVINARIRTFIQRRYADLLLASERYDECAVVLESCYNTCTEHNVADSVQDVLEKLVTVAQRRQDSEPSSENEAAVGKWQLLLQQHTQEHSSD